MRKAPCPRPTSRGNNTKRIDLARRKGRSRRAASACDRCRATPRLDHLHDAVAASLVGLLRALCMATMATVVPTNKAEGGRCDHVQLAAGLRASLRITADGDVVLTVPGGELTITAGACELGLGLLEASRRAAQIRRERGPRKAWRGRR